MLSRSCWPIYSRTHFELCEWMRATIQVYNLLSRMPLGNEKKKDITKILHWTLSFEFNDSCFHFVSFFHFRESRRCRSVHSERFHFYCDIVTNSREFPREFLFSFLKFQRGKQASEWMSVERAYNSLLSSTENRTEVLNFVCADLLVNQ